MTVHRTQPLGDLLQVLVGPSVWFAHLTVLYGAEALICTSFAAAGHAMVWIAAAATIAGLGALVLLATLVRRSATNDHEEQSAAFLRALTLLLVLLSALGMIWTAVPVALLPTCATSVG